MTSSYHHIALFEGKEVRKVIYNDEWFFSVVDVVEILTDSTNPTDYLKKIRKRDFELGSYIGTNCPQVEMLTETGKKRKTLAGNTKNILRIIQSIPSPRAEPFKQWLAKVGYERIQEINDPELSMQRMIETYEKKGYPKEWIDIRTRGIPVRKGLTKERDERGGDQAYGILTNEIYKAYTGMDNKNWMAHKGMKNGNLRDGMSPTELILTMLAEQATTDITKSRDTKGVQQLKTSAKDGGGVALKARQELIEQTGKDPITDSNYLTDFKEEQKILPQK